MKVEVFTHPWCEGCRNLKINETIIYANGYGDLVNRSCENYRICQNAVELYRESEFLAHSLD